MGCWMFPHKRGSLSVTRGLGFTFMFTFKFTFTLTLPAGPPRSPPIRSRHIDGGGDKLTDPTPDERPIPTRVKGKVQPLPCPPSLTNFSSVLTLRLYLYLYLFRPSHHSPPKPLPRRQGTDPLVVGCHRDLRVMTPKHYQTRSDHDTSCLCPLSDCRPVRRPRSPLMCLASPRWRGCMPRPGP